MTGWFVGQLKAAVCEYLAANWGMIALYLIVAAVMCWVLRKLLSVYGTMPVIVGVVLLIIGAFAVGIRSAPIKTVVTTVEKPVVRTVERVVTDTSGMERLRSQLAALRAEKDAALAALAKLRRELAAALAECDRLTRELNAKPVVQNTTPEANAQCVACGHLMDVRLSILKEQIRCRNCGRIQSARSAVARRAYVLDHRKR